jgi:hypothetical protein
MGSLTPNDVDRFAQHVREGDGRKKKEKNGVLIIPNASILYIKIDIDILQLCDVQNNTRSVS